jgi:hypothetical protein
VLYWRQCWSHGNGGRFHVSVHKVGDDGDRAVTVDARVRVYPGTDGETHGVVVEDFGESAGHAVDVGAHHVADPARRWAVRLDTGGLVFVDSDELAPE